MHLPLMLVDTSESDTSARKSYRKLVRVTDTSRSIIATRIGEKNATTIVNPKWRMPSRSILWRSSLRVAELDAGGLQRQRDA